MVPAEPHDPDGLAPFRLSSDRRPLRLLGKLLPPGTSYGEHAHGVVSLTLTLAGEYEEEFESGRHVCRLLSLQLKPTAVPHTTRAELGASLFLAHLAPETVAIDVDGSRERPRLWKPGALSALALALCAEQEGSRGPRAEALARALVRGIRQDAAHAAGSAPDWIVPVRRRLEAELAAPPRLGALARDADVHPVHLARVFRRSFGRSVGGWIRRARVDRAVRALAGTEEDLASIALRLGFYDQSHLGRAFRLETGWSPARFRRDVRARRLSPAWSPGAGFRSS